MWLRAQGQTRRTMHAVPELPEVENVVRSMRSTVGRQLSPIAVAQPHERFSEYALAYGRVESVERQGKWILVGLDPGELRPLTLLGLHLGMSGQLLLTPDLVEATHVRARWALGGGGVVTLRDPRAFGRVVFRESRQDMDAWMSGRVANDPLKMTGEEFWRALAKGTRPLKARLLDQSVVSGVGNIYADESLWAAQLNPFSRTITREQSDLLLSCLREVLLAAIDNGGASLRDYRKPDGSRGSAQTQLACYGRAGYPCTRCGSLLAAARLAGRSTVLCPECQGTVG